MTKQCVPSRSPYNVFQNMFIQLLQHDSIVASCIEWTDNCDDEEVSVRLQKAT